MARKKIVLYSTTDDLLKGYALSAQKEEKQALKAKGYVYLRGKKLNSGNLSLFIDICRNNKRVKQYLGLYLNIETSISVKNQNEETFRIAKTIAAEKNVSLQKDENGFTLSKKTKVNLFTYILFQADEALKKSGNPHGYYYTLQSLAKHVVLYSGDKTAFHQVDKDYLIGFINYLKTAKNFNYKRSGDVKRDKDVVISQNTQHNLFMKFKYVIRKALKAGVITVNPLDVLEDSDKPKAEGGTREYLTIQEIKKLIATDFKYDTIKRAFLFCCLVGLRYGDAASITWEDLSEDNNGDSVLRLKIKKTAREEIFPVSAEAMKMLPDKGEAADSDIIFSLPKNDHANKYIKKWVTSAGIKKKITFHVARHRILSFDLRISKLQEIFS